MLLASTAAAHHSFSAYDMSKIVTVEATIKEFNWGAPHSSGVFLVVGPDQQVHTITVVAPAPNLFVEQGFRARDFKVGDKVTLTYHPLRSGDVNAGSLAAIVFPDGRRFGVKEVSEGATPGAAGPPPGASGLPPAQ